MKENIIQVIIGLIIAIGCIAIAVAQILNGSIVGFTAFSAIAFINLALCKWQLDEMK